VTEGADARAAATVRSTSHDFVVWGTKRRPWQDFVELEGDEAYATAVLDAVKII
jgi:hypothetical protein